MARYAIYKHQNLINQKIYIGLTCQNPPSKRWANGKGYAHNEHFSQAIEKYGWENFSHEIIEWCETLEEANLAEQQWIKYYESTNPNKGYNLSGGGASNNGFHHSEETKQKMSASAQKRQVICLETGVVYESLSEAARVTNNDLNNIRDCCIGRQKTTQGKHWQYYDDNMQTIEEIEKVRYSTQCKAVRCIELNQIFKSAAEASRELNINNRNIGACCQGKRQTAGGYHWEFVKEEVNG